jgi:ATP-dependent DNA helicase RecG
MELNDSLSVLPLGKPKLLKTIQESMGLQNIQDLLLYFPSRYLDFSKFTNIQDLEPGEVVTVRGIVKSIAARFSFHTRSSLAEAVISDQTGSIKVVWFNQGYVAKSLRNGDEVLLSGKVASYKNILQLTNPIYEKLTAEHIHTGRLVPVYKLPEGVFPKTFRTLVHAALPAASSLRDLLPSSIRKTRNLLDLKTTVWHMHFPDNATLLHAATRRLSFEENFVQQLAVATYKRDLKRLAAPSISPNFDGIKKAITNLPFTLTDDQKKALWHILQDLEHKHPMNRLLQGDVGSGKTIVALLAALEVVAHNLQVVILAPTEVLANQHYESIARTLEQIAIGHTPPSLFTRTFHIVNGEKTTKHSAVEALANGTAQIIIGTHALLESEISFHSLALVIVDEQHRFGVAQRRAITGMRLQKSTNSKRYWHPHLLSMSATPIPRSAALALYGDLDITVIDELPKDRLPIKTWLVPEHKRKGAYEFVEKEIKAGRQAFIITPLVGESDRLAVKSAKAEFKRLAKDIFPTFSLGLLYGSMKSAEKEKVMSAFAQGTIHILVSTSVVEVGIDIANATVMLIENADRFGLAQLHQLRGRVGRSTHQSYCFLFSETASSAERLELFAKTRSGFTLAEYDLKTRGFGSLFGDSQTGFQFKYGAFMDAETITEAKESAEELLAQDPLLKKYPLLGKLVFPLSKNIHLE